MNKQFDGLFGDRVRGLVAATTTILRQSLWLMLLLLGWASSAQAAILTGLTGLWWNPAESGWGLNITQQDSSVHMGWYTYDTTGNPTWFVMPSCPVVGSGCTGTIYKMTGGTTLNLVWNGNGVATTTVGTGTLTFTDNNTGTFNYTLNGASGSKTITRQMFASGTSQPATDYSALWGNQAESGWWVALTQDVGMIFAMLYSYDASGNPVWYVASSCPLSGNGCTGDLYQVSGGSAPTAAWSANLAVTTVGTVSFSFSDSSNGTMSYTINGVAGSKTIERIFGTVAPTGTQTGIPAAERQVLLDLYASTNGAGWTNNTGWNGAAGTECTWFGVTCDAAQSHVTGISLVYNNLVGTLPSLSGLTALQGFNVNWNQLTGTIPSLSGLAALQSFIVSYNQLTGSIPSLSGLTALTDFDVRANRLTGPVPAAPTSLFSGMSNLCGNSLVSSGDPAIDAAWTTATGSNWLACQTTASSTLYTLSASRTGTGSGTITSDTGGIDCGTSCWADYASGTVTLAATPATGSYFAGWSGDCSGTGQCSVTMDAARNVTATFEPEPFVAITTSIITATIATVSTQIAFNPSDVGKEGAVYITGWVPVSGLGALGIATASLNPSMSVATASNNPYLGGKINSRQVELGTLLATSVSNDFVLVQLTQTGWQLVTNGQLIPYASGVLGDQLAAQSILNNADTTGLQGAEFYVGYGVSTEGVTSAEEMVEAERIRLVATIPCDTGSSCMAESASPVLFPATDQTIDTFIFSSATLAVGDAATVSATATSGLAVSFTSATPDICTVSGSTVTGVSAGTCTIAADQAGDGSYNAASQVTQSITVTPATTFTGTRAEYRITQSGGSYTVTDLTTGRDDTRTVTSADHLTFSDMTVNLTVQAKAASIAAADLQRLQELYVAFFNRVPAADGLAYWIDQFAAGSTISQIADSFYAAGVANSSLTGFSSTMSNGDFVHMIYRNVLGRPEGAGASGLAYWSGELDGMRETRGSLAASILNSAHSFKGDATYGWVADLLDNKIAVANQFSVTLGLTYSTPEASISNGMAIAAAVTSTSTAAALALIGVGQ